MALYIGRDRFMSGNIGLATEGTSVHPISLGVANL
jgi:hypothetical protein